MAIKFFACFFPTISTFGCFWSQWPTSLAVTSGREGVRTTSFKPWRPHRGSCRGATAIEENNGSRRERCGAGGCRREATWISPDIWSPKPSSTEDTRILGVKRTSMRSVVGTDSKAGSTAKLLEAWDGDDDWLVVDLPLWKIWVSNSWDDYSILFPIYGKIKAMFQTTKQMMIVDEYCERCELTLWIDLVDYGIIMMFTQIHNPPENRNSTCTFCAWNFFDVSARFGWFRWPFVGQSWPRRSHGNLQRSRQSPIEMCYVVLCPARRISPVFQNDLTNWNLTMI